MGAGTFLKGPLQDLLKMDVVVLIFLSPTGYVLVHIGSIRLEYQFELLVLIII